jgi:hypothetical protein
MDYNGLLEELKNNHFPELKDENITLKPLKILKKAFMVAFPLSKNIHYNVNAIKTCNEAALKAVLVHELCHRVQFKNMSLSQRLILVPKYHLNDRFRQNHEREANIEVIKRGFGEELIELNKFVKNRHPKEVWENKISNYYLSDIEIQKIMKK